jgi:hypothetical protein
MKIKLTFCIRLKILGAEKFLPIYLCIKGCHGRLRNRNKLMETPITQTMSYDVTEIHTIIIHSSLIEK